MTRDYGEGLYGDGLYGADGAFIGAPKQVLFHVYTAAGVVIRTWPDVASMPTYDWPINSGPGVLNVQLPRAWGTAGEPGETGSLSDIAHGNLVKVYVVDRESGPGGVIIWQGTIQHYTASLADEVFALTLVPKTSELVDHVINDTISFAATDPTNMIKYLVDNDYLPGITWDASNPLVGLTFDLSFDKGKVSQLIDLARGLAGGKWYLRLNPDNSLSFNKWSPDVATHRLIIGKHVASDVRFERSSLEVKKRVIFYGDTGIVGVAQLPGYDPTVTPQDEALANVRVQDTATANRLAASRLEMVEAPTIATEFSVIDSNLDPDRGYDIESLKPGHTVSLVHPSSVFAPWRWDGASSYGTGLYWGGPWTGLSQHPFVIASIQYGFVGARLKLASIPPLLPTELVSMADHLLLTAAR